MPEPDRLLLLHGPYRPPRVRRGDRLFCEIRGTVTVGGYTDGPIPWPRVKKGGNPSLILCGDLVRAVRVESNVAVCHHFGVSTHTVSKWRKALSVAEQNKGTLRLQHDWAVGREDDRLARARRQSKSPAAIAKLTASLKGRPPSSGAMKAAHAAAQRPRSTAWKRKMAQLWRERGNWLQPNTVSWTADQDALLGTAPDAEVARRLGRSLSAVYTRRYNLGIGSHLVPIDGRALRRLRLKAGLSQDALAHLAGVHRARPGELETGRERSIARAASPLSFPFRPVITWSCTAPSTGPSAGALGAERGSARADEEPAWRQALTGPLCPLCITGESGD